MDKVAEREDDKRRKCMHKHGRPRRGRAGTQNERAYLRAALRPYFMSVALLRNMACCALDALRMVAT